MHFYVHISLMLECYHKNMGNEIIKNLNQIEFLKVVSTQPRYSIDLQLEQYTKTWYIKNLTAIFAILSAAVTASVAIPSISGWNQFDGSSGSQFTKPELVFSWVATLSALSFDFREVNDDIDRKYSITEEYNLLQQGMDFMKAIAFSISKGRHDSNNLEMIVDNFVYEYLTKYGGFDLIKDGKAVNLIEVLNNSLSVWKDKLKYNDQICLETVEPFFKDYDDLIQAISNGLKQDNNQFKHQYLSIHDDNNTDTNPLLSNYYPETTLIHDEVDAIKSLIDKSSEDKVKQIKIDIIIYKFFAIKKANILKNISDEDEKIRVLDENRDYLKKWFRLSNFSYMDNSYYGVSSLFQTFKNSGVPVSNLNVLAAFAEGVLCAVFTVILISALFSANINFMALPIGLIVTLTVLCGLASAWPSYHNTRKFIQKTFETALYDLLEWVKGSKQINDKKALFAISIALLTASGVGLLIFFVALTTFAVMPFPVPILLTSLVSITLAAFAFIAVFSKSSKQMYQAYDLLLDHFANINWPSIIRKSLGSIVFATAIMLIPLAFGVNLFTMSPLIAFAIMAASFVLFGSMLTNKSSALNWASMNINSVSTIFAVFFAVSLTLLTLTGSLPLAATVAAICSVAVATHHYCNQYVVLIDYKMESIKEVVSISENDIEIDGDNIPLLPLNHTDQEFTI